MRKKSSSSRKIRFCPTQKDIADALGVSQSTVAMALSPQHEHKLMAETVERIRRYAAEVGYHPQRFAQIMQGGHTKIIGVIVRLGVYSNNHEMVALLANELNRAGYRLVLVDPVWFAGDCEAVKKWLLDQGVEGVVFCNITVSNEAQALQSQLPPTLPTFGLQSSLHSGPDVHPDLEAAYYHMTRLHLALGSRSLSLLSMFRDVGYLGRPDWPMRDRVLGFVRAIQEAGGTVVADEAVRELLEIPGCLSLSAPSEGIVGRLILPEKVSKVRNSYENGYHQTLRMIAGDILPDSLICNNDDGAMGALAACSDRGIQVPTALRISGHDDTLAGRFGIVPLTTIRPPLETMVKKTAEGIVSRIGSHQEPVGKALSPIPCEIVVTGSIGTREEIQEIASAGFFKPGKEISFEWAPNEERLCRFENLIASTNP